MGWYHTATVAFVLLLIGTVFLNIDFEPGDNCPESLLGFSRCVPKEVFCQNNDDCTDKMCAHVDAHSPGVCVEGDLLCRALAPYIARSINALVFGALFIAFLVSSIPVIVMHLAKFPVLTKPLGASLYMIAIGIGTINIVLYVYQTCLG